MIKILTNATSSEIFISDCGQAISASESLTIDPSQYLRYAQSNDVLPLIASGDLVVNDGSTDLSASLGLDLIKGYVQRFPITSDMMPKFSVYEPEGDFKTFVSHDFCDKTTWYSSSTRVTGASAASVSGLAYTLSHTNIIDVYNGKITGEDDLVGDYGLVVYDGASQVSEFSVDYAAGVVTLSSAPGSSVTFDYSYANDSVFKLSPPTGKEFSLNRAEIQFTKDIAYTPIVFEVWGVNPYDPPNTIMYERVSYKTIKDILNISNLGYAVPNFGGLGADVIIFPFDYQRAIKIRSDYLMEIRVKIVSDTPISGTFATVSFYCAEYDL